MTMNAGIFMNVFSFQYLSNILEELTPDDVRCLLLTEDELARSAPLERILPAPNSHRYVCFTEHPRYYNRLLDAWEHRYCNNRAEGIALLQSLCQQKIHLQVPPSTFKKVSNFQSCHHSSVLAILHRYSYRLKIAICKSNPLEQLSKPFITL